MGTTITNNHRHRHGFTCIYAMCVCIDFQRVILVTMEIDLCLLLLLVPPMLLLFVDCAVLHTARRTLPSHLLPMHKMFDRRKVIIIMKRAHRLSHTHT